jgi:hypothetical protein
LSSTLLDTLKAGLSLLASTHNTMPVPDEDTILQALLTAAIRGGEIGSGGICPLETTGATEKMLCVAVVVPNGPGQTYKIHGLALERSKLSLVAGTQQSVETPPELSPQQPDTLKDLPTRSI